MSKHQYTNLRLLLFGFLRTKYSDPRNIEMQPQPCQRGTFGSRGIS